MSEETVTMPLALTPALIRAVRDDPLCQVPREQWHERLGWLICAWDVLVEHRLPPKDEAPGEEVAGGLGTPNAATALQELHRVCLQMDAERQDDRPTEEEYQQAMATAGQALKARAAKAG